MEQLRLGRVPDPLGTQDNDLDPVGLFKTSQQAYRQDVVPTSRGREPSPAPVSDTPVATKPAAKQGGSFTFDLYKGTQTEAAPTPPLEKREGKFEFDLYANQRPKEVASAPDETQSGAFSRGLKSGGIESAKETAVGAAALVSHTVGAKDTADSLFSTYKGMTDKAQSEAQPYESFSNVTEGKAGFGDFLKYWGGYALGQAAQTVAVGAAGAVAGSAVGPEGTLAGAIGGVMERQAVQTGIKKLVAEKLEQSVATHMAEAATKGLAKEEAQKYAYSQAAKTVFRDLGAAAGVTGYNVAMEGASIYGEARDEAAKHGENVDLGRVWSGTIMAAATESAMDFVGLKGIQKAFGGGNILKNIMVESFKGGLREGSTEAVQSGFERYGAKKDLTSDEAKREYVDSAAAGAVGGVLFGSAKGTVKSLRGEEDNKPKTLAEANALFDKKKEETNLNSAGFVKEPLAQLETQINALREDRKPVVVAGLDEANQLKNTEGLHKFEISDPNTGAIAAVFSKNETDGEQIQARANEVGLKQAMGEALGYVNPVATTVAPENAVVVQQIDEKTGHIILEQAVAKDQVDSIKPIPGTTINITTAEQAKADRIGEPATDTKTAVDEAANKAATSPNNDLAPPTDAQKSAGNYQKGHVTIKGLNIAIENPAGSTRSGIDADGKEWTSTMAHHYGYVKGSVGNDKDHVDVFIGENPDSNTVYVIDQKSPDGKFDEHKGLIGFDSEEEAVKAYHANYEEGWQGMGAVTAMPMDAFKSWVKDGTKRKPLAYNPDASPAPKTETKTETKTEPKKETKKEKVKKSEAKAQAIESWEDNDDGVEPHIPFHKLSKEAQSDWMAASNPDDGAKPYNTVELHDEIVAREQRNVRTERSNAKAAENRKGKEEADGIDLKRTEQPKRDFSYVKVKSISDLERAANKQLELEGNGETVELSAVPVGSLVGKLPGLGVIEQAAKLFGKQVKYFRVIGGTNFFDGAVIPGSNTIFINVNSKHPHLRIFGHELVHAIKNQHPQTYERLKNFLMPMLDEAGMIQFALKQKQDGVTDKEAILEEAIGDIVGDRFGEREFWNMMADEHPSLFRQIAKIAMDFIDKLIGQITSEFKNLGSSTLIKDLNTTRNHIATVLTDLGDMVQEEQTPAQQTATGEATPKLKRTEKEVKPFYSALEQAFKNPKINLDKNGATTGEQWKAWLNSKRGEMGVKKDEIKWTGIEEYFELNKKEKLTTEQVKNWVAGNKVRINDILLTSYGKASEAQGAVAEFREPTEYDLREFVRDRIDEHEEERDLSDYDEEAFGVSPDDMNDPELRAWIAENFGWQNFMYQYRREMERFQRGRVDKMTKPKHETGNLVMKGGKNYAELVLFDPTTSPYNQQDNIHYGDVAQGKAIGWIRMNERKDVDGNDVLFLEELQSQRAQHGREKGFDSLTLSERKELETLHLKELAEDGLLSDDLARVKELEGKAEGVPKAPFVEDTRAWTSLLIKRAIAYAQSRGIDRIVWTTGEQQNNRYKYPGDELVYKMEKGSNTFTLTVNKDGEHIRTASNVPLDALAAYVGDKTASEIQASEGMSGVLRGDDLKVMEANLQPYYNQTIPSVVKEIAGKDSVKIMEIEGTGQQLGFVIPEELQKMVEEDGLPMFKRSAYEAQFDDLPANVRAMAVAKGHYSPPTIKERLDSLKPNLWLRVVQGTFDRFRRVRDISMKAYMMLRLSTSVDGAVEGLLHFGQVFNDDGALNLKKGTKGLLQVLNPVGGEVDRFLLWIAANRAGQLKKEDRERFFSQEEIDNLKKLNLGTMKNGKFRAGVYAEVLKDMNELNKSVLDVARQNGLINEEGYKKFSTDIWYIPFYRVMEEDGSLSAAQTSSAAVGQYLTKKLKGSERQLNDLMQNVLLNWSHILSASMKNAAAVETLSAAEKLPDTVTKLTKVDAKFGVDKAGNKYALKYAVKVMEKGEESYYVVEDEFLLASLDAVASIPSYGFWTTTARQFKTTLTRFVSLSPTFKINNLIRDSVQAMGTSELKLNPVANVIQGWRAYSDDRAEALVGGGLFAMGNAYDGDRAAHVKRLIDMGVDKADILTNAEKAKKWFNKSLEKYDEWSDASENANRLALYQQLRQNKATHLEAAYAARDLQDFSLQGNWVAIRYASMILPYFNARLQGLYKLGRSVQDDPRRLGVVLGAVTFVGLALYLSQKDDDDWRKREEWDKDAFFWFKLPGTEHAVRIPKPFEMGAFETIVERFTEQIVDDSVEGKVFGQRLLAILHDNLAVNPVPQIVRPIYDIARNKDGFTDRPIESMGAERLSPENRVNAGTSAFGVTMGTINGMFADFVSTVTGEAVDANKLKLSPIQYDYLLRGYLGWVGTSIETTSNVIAKPFKAGEDPDMRVDDIFIVGNYVKSMPQDQSRYVTSFYENSKEIAMATADFQSFLQAGNLDKASEILEEKRDKIAMHKLYSNISDRMSTIQKQIVRIKADETMSGEEKRIEMSRLSQLRIELAKSVEEARIDQKRN